jgi:hypothetical protein
VFVWQVPGLALRLSSEADRSGALRPGRRLHQEAAHGSILGRLSWRHANRAHSEAAAARRVLQAGGDEEEDDADGEAEGAQHSTADGTSSAGGQVEVQRPRWLDCEESWWRQCVKDGKIVQPVAVQKICKALGGLWTSSAGSDTISFADAGVLHGYLSSSGALRGVCVCVCMCERESERERRMHHSKRASRVVDCLDHLCTSDKCCYGELVCQSPGTELLLCLHQASASAGLTASLSGRLAAIVRVLGRVAGLGFRV